MISFLKSKKPSEINNRFSNWISKIGQDSKPGKNIIAINFGIFQTEHSYSIYLIGSTEYDIEDSDWACNEDFVPQDKYFELTKNETKGSDWTKIEELVSNLLKNYTVSDNFKNSFLINIENITCGFDDGELIKIK